MIVQNRVFSWLNDGTLLACSLASSTTLVCVLVAGVWVAMSARNDILRSILFLRLSHSYEAISGWQHVTTCFYLIGDSLYPSASRVYDVFVALYSAVCTSVEQASE